MALKQTGIAVIIPTYNRLHSVKRAIDSVLAQTLAPDEIIIVDDASTDGTVLALDSYYGPKIKLVKHHRNLGAAEARNSGIASAKAAYLSFLDSDDSWLSNKLEKQYRFMVEHDLDASCTNVQITYDNGNIRQSVRRPYPNILTYDEIAYGCYISPGSTLIIKRECILSIGGYRPEFKRYEDWDFLLRLLHNKGRLGYIQQDLALVYADHDFSTTDALSALEMVRQRHRDVIKTQYKNVLPNFDAGIHFNKGATYIHAGNYIKGAMSLVWSFLVKPRKNWLWRHILIPKIL